MNILLNAGKIIVGAKTKKVFSGPFFMQIGISNVCNYRCVMCWDHPSFIDQKDLLKRGDNNILQYNRPTINYSEGKTIMPLDIYKRLIDEISLMGTYQIKICGHGEPLLNKNVVEMVRYTTFKKISCQLVTNGALLNFDNLKGLSDAGLNRLHISLNAATLETYHKIHNEPKEKFTHIVELLKNFKLYKIIKLQLSFVITALNYHELNAFINLSKECGADRVVFVLVTTYKQTEMLKLSIEQQNEFNLLLEEAIILAARNNIKTNLYDLKKNIDLRINNDNSTINIYNKIPCYIGWYFSQINADGVVTPCCECINSLGNINNLSFKEIWNGLEYSTFRRLSRDIHVNKKFPTGCRCNDCGFQLNNSIFNKILNPFMENKDSPFINKKDIMHLIKKIWQ